MNAMSPLPPFVTYGEAYPLAGFPLDVVPATVRGFSTPVLVASTLAAGYLGSKSKNRALYVGGLLAAAYGGIILWGRLSGEDELGDLGLPPVLLGLTAGAIAAMRRSVAQLDRQIARKRRALAKAKSKRRQAGLRKDIARLQGKRARILAAIARRAQRRTSKGKDVTRRQARLLGAKAPKPFKASPFTPVEEGVEASTSFEPSTQSDQAQVDPAAAADEMAVEAMADEATGAWYKNPVVWGIGGLVLVGGLYAVSRKGRKGGITRIVSMPRARSTV